jgi:hypothetical protein
MNYEIFLSRLAPVTDEQAAARVSRQALSELSEEIIRTAPRRDPAAPDRTHTRRASGTNRRLPLLAAATALAAGAAVAVAVIAPADQQAPRGEPAKNETPGPRLRPTPAASDKLAAWTVTENQDGTVKVTIREMDDPSGLQEKLQADGVRVVVTASLGPPAPCREWHAGDYTMGNRVLWDLNRTGLPSADGTEFFIRPSAIPAGALLWLGISQTGKPNGVAGPPGPMGSGYVQASQACIHS